MQCERKQLLCPAFGPETEKHRVKLKPANAFPPELQSARSHESAISLIASRLRELFFCELLLLLNHPEWTLLFPIYLLSYYGADPNRRTLTRTVRRTLYRLFALRIVKAAPFRKTRFLCDLDSVYHLATEHLRSKTQSLFSLKDRVIVDVGAHYGLVSIGLAALLPATGRVIAVEPSPPNYAILEYNIRLNQLSNIVTLNVAVTDYNGTVIMASEDEVSTHYRAIPCGGSEGGFNVGCCRFSEILDKMEISKADLVKIDIEGAELEVLKDSFPSIAPRVQKLDIEVHQGKELATIIGILKASRYSVQVNRTSILSNSYRVFARKIPEDQNPFA